jgi:uncharacterized protein (DUF1684 family)
MLKMNKLIKLIAIALVFTACDTSSKWKPTQEVISESGIYVDLSPYGKQVMRHRDSMSAMFLSGANGVMPKSDLSPVGKLNYYPVEEVFKVKATFTPIENGEVFEMQTNTDRLPEYRYYGVLSFKMADTTLELTLYQNVEQPDYLFCPFKDLTNGKDTYGAGRYLDFQLADLDNPILDFNYAYNPYCAYNKEYSCPIPPIENHLQVPITAGEKTWH